MPFGIRCLVKEKGKNFFNLTKEDVANMIDAYLLDGNDYFEYDALTEFMIIPNDNDALERVRRMVEDIDERHRKPTTLDGLASNDGRADLAALSQALRDGSW